MITFIYGGKPIHLKTDKGKSYIGYDDSIKTYTRCLDSGISTAVSDYTFFKFTVPKDITPESINIFVEPNSQWGSNQNHTVLITDSEMRRIYRAGGDKNTYTATTATFEKADGTTFNMDKFSPPLNLLPKVNDFQPDPVLHAGTEYWFGIFNSYNGVQTWTKTLFVDGPNKYECKPFTSSAYNLLQYSETGTQIKNSDCGTAVPCPLVYFELIGQISNNVVVDDIVVGDNEILIGNDIYETMQVGNYLWTTTNLKYHFASGSHTHGDNEFYLREKLPDIRALLPDGWDIPDETAFKDLLANKADFNFIQCGYEDADGSYKYNGDRCYMMGDDPNFTVLFYWYRTDGTAPTPDEPTIGDAYVNNLDYRFPIRICKKIS